MDYIVVTVRAQNKSRDLELPADIWSYELAGGLAESFELPRSTSSGKTIYYKLASVGHDTWSTSHSLDPNKTLAQSGIVTGRILSLLPVESGVALLKLPSGRMFLLDCPEKQLFTLGRSAGNQRPDIDLGQEPQGETVSRVHAQLYQQGGRWYIIQVTPNNVTRVNGTVLTANQAYSLPSDVQVTLGDLECTFQVS